MLDTLDLVLIVLVCLVKASASILAAAGGSGARKRLVTGTQDSSR